MARVFIYLALVMATAISTLASEASSQPASKPGKYPAEFEVAYSSGGIATFMLRGDGQLFFCWVTSEPLQCTRAYVLPETDSTGSANKFYMARSFNASTISLVSNHGKVYLCTGYTYGIECTGPVELLD